MSNGIVKTVREVLFATELSTGLLAGMGLAAGVLILYLYRLERRMIRRPVGVILLAIRLALVGSIVLMLGEPIVHRMETRSTPATVVVLADDSASMDTADASRSAGDLLREAYIAGLIPDTARPVRLDAAATVLRFAARQLGPAAAVTAHRDGPDDPRAAAMRQAGAIVSEVVDRLADDAGERTMLSSKTALDIIDLRSRLEKRIAEGLSRWNGRLASDDRSGADGLAEWAGMARDDLASLSAELERIGQGADRDQAERASPDTLAAAAALAQETRRQRLRRILAASQGNWLDKLGEQTRLRIIPFAASTGESVAGFPSQPAESRPVASSRPSTRTPSRSASAPGSQPGTRPATLAASQRSSAPADAEFDWRLGTDLARAIREAAAQAAGGQVNAVLLVTDGQHNASGDPLQAAAELRDQRIPLTIAPIGQSAPPRDALVRRVDAPRSLFLKDEYNVEALIETHELAGRTLVVQLKEGGQVVAQETAKIEAPNAKHTVRLTHQPATVGRHVYELAIVPMEGEAFAENNLRTLMVEVNQERINVLVVDGEPRWEFRYLKNLLVRDEGTRLQYVLFSPGYIEGAPAPAPVTANVKSENPEADRLPDEQEQLNAFDVIVLGDVSPGDLPRKQQQMIESFVAERGGTLVIIAGPRSMPGDYELQPLAQLIPLDLTASRPAVETRPADPDAGLRLQLSKAGLESPMLDLAADPERNQRIWNQFPNLQWASPYRQAQQAAEVLAWFAAAERPDTRPATAAAESPDDRGNAAIIRKSHGLGKVVHLAGDFTWRLRFRVGDRHHHKFWSQMLRWAGAGRFAGGSKTIRIGTDRDRYRAGQPLAVTAKLSTLDHVPVPRASVTVTALRDGRPVASARMEPSMQAGEYQAALAHLAPGQYVLRLSGPEIDELLASEQARPPVETLAIVDPAETVERDNLECNRQLLERIARAAGGDVIDLGSLDAWALHVDTSPHVARQAEQKPLWTDYRWLLVFLALITAEWIIRKRVGLI